MKKYFVTFFFIIIHQLFAISPYGEGYYHLFLGYSPYEQGYYSINIETQNKNKSLYGVETGYFTTKSEIKSREIDNTIYSIIPYKSFWLLNLFSNSINLTANIGPGFDFVDNDFEINTDIFLKNDILISFSYRIHKLNYINFFAKYQNRIYLFKNSYSFDAKRDSWQKFISFGIGLDF